MRVNEVNLLLFPKSVFYYLDATELITEEQQRHLMQLNSAPTPVPSSLVDQSHLVVQNQPTQTRNDAFTHVRLIDTHTGKFSLLKVH